MAYGLSRQNRIRKSARMNWRFPFILMLLAIFICFGAQSAWAAAPTANAGGPYAINEGDSVSLDGSGSTDDGSIVSYEWDLNNDNNYGDVTGATPSVSWATLQSFGITNDGSYPIGLRVTDDEVLTDTTTTTINVVNVAPTADGNTGVAYAVTEGNSLTLAGSGSDANSNDTLTYTWDINGDGTFGDAGLTTATPTVTWAALDALGINDTGSPYTVVLRVGDGTTTTDSAGETLTVTNAAPTAADDTDTAGEDGPSIVIEVTANDVDPASGDDVEVQSVDTAAFATKGIVNIEADNDNITYDPNGQFESLAVGETEEDKFNYTVNDGDGGTDTATVTITISGVNDDPVPVGDTNTTDEDTAITVTAADANDLLENDTDVDASDTLSVVAYTGSSAKGAAVTVSADGGYSYDPSGSATLQALAAGESTTDTFTYTLEDPHTTATGTVTITVNGVNDAPVGTADSIGVNEDATTANLVAALLSNDTDTDTSDVLMVQIASVNTAGTKGTVTVADNGSKVTSITYAADHNDFDALKVGETATDTFAYTVNDGNGGTDTATVTVTITGVNDDPVPDFTLTNPASPGSLPGLTATEPVTINFTDLSVDVDSDGIASWAWVFGDGGTSTEQNPTHVYSTDPAVAGKDSTTYNVSLTVTDAQGVVRSKTINNALTVNDVDPAASFTIYDYFDTTGTRNDKTGNEPLVVDFTDTTTSHDGVTWTWNLGDGTTSTQRNVKGHSYAQQGTYPVTLTVTEPDGDTSTATDTVTVADTVPTAQFTVDFPSGPEPHTIQTSEFSTVYAGDAPLTYLWNFGDGTTSTEKEPAHTYTQNGSFTVTLTVTDNDGSTDTATTVITVTDSSPDADFTGSPSSGTVPLTVVFEDLTTSYDTIVEWGWSFGDGETSTEQNPTHEYTSAGEYNVVMSVKDADDSIATAQITVTVIPDVPDPDADNDGWTIGDGDCDDNDASINPGAAEICGDNIDQDCFDGDLACPPQGECTSLGDKPLDTQLQGDPPNIMLVIDDSGSMDWEVLVDPAYAASTGNKTDDGLFWVGSDDYYYLNEGLDNLWHDSVWPSVNGDSDTTVKRRWLARFYNYNVMYYNPNYAYQAWTNEADADVNFPRAHPMDSSVTMDLNDTLYTVNIAGASGGGGGGEDVILDEESGAADSGSWGYDPGSSGAHNGDDRYISGDVTAKFKWTWTPTVTGDYDISFYTTSYYFYDQNARYDYQIGNSKANTNANQDTGGWQTLWTSVSLTAGTPIEVSVSRDKTKSTEGSYTVADAIRFTASGSGGSTSSTAANITHAHYHTFNDTNSNGELDTGEDQYLVNFTDSDNNNAFDAREFYLFVDADNDERVDDGELSLVDEADVPSALKNRSYAEDLQNFANWFSFYRKRWLTTVAALSLSLPEFQGVNLGYRTINGNGVQPVLPMRVAGKADNTDTILNALKNFRLVRNPASTPLRDGLNKVGLYFHTTATSGSLESELQDSPLSTDGGGACQQNFALMFTDGSWNGGATSVPSGMVTSGKNQDGDNGVPYADTYGNTLADVAMTWYENDLAPAIADEVPTNFYDKATWQHMVTYSITFGVYGNLNPDDYDLYNLDVDQRVYPTWTDPISGDDEDRIDDVYHAAVNGRGQYLSAKNPLELVEKIKEVIRDVISRIGSGSAVTINGEELDTGSVVYQSIYSTDGWTGDVKAYEIDLTTGEVDRANPLWSSEEELYGQTWDAGRIIATYNGSTGIPFRFNAAYDNLFNLLDPDDAVAEDMIEYLRGDDSKEVRNGGGYRNRTITLSDGITVRSSKLGDIVHSSPVFQRYLHNGTYYDTLYAGGNDGMLHAFDGDTGEEQFAYIPKLVFHNLKELTTVGYEHLYYVDLSPYVADLYVEVATSGEGDGLDNDGDTNVDEVGEQEPRTFLVGGLGKGGRGYYALDVTDPKAITTESELANAVKWEYPSAFLQITGATNATPIVITTATDHGLADGDFVNLFGIEGNTAANGTWRITKISNTAFSLQKDDGTNSVGGGTYTAGTGKASIDPDMGYSYSRGFLVNSRIGYVVIFGNGYNSPARNAVLYVLDAATGTLLKKIDTQHGVYGDGTTSVGNCNGLSTPQLVDVDADNLVDYAYAGDLNGNLWKFDLTSTDINDWEVAYQNSASLPQPVFQARDENGIPQPITGMPDIMRPCDRNMPGYFAIFGTGKYLGPEDFSAQTTQTIYGIWDYGDDADDGEYLGYFDRGGTTELSNLSAKSTLLEQEVLTDVVISGTAYRVLTQNAVNYAIVDDLDNVGVNPDPSNAEDNNVGWYFDLPERKERAVRDAIIRSGKAIIISSLPNTSPCSAGGESFLHEMDACTGGRIDTAQFDINNDDVIDDNDLIKVLNPDYDPDDPLNDPDDEAYDPFDPDDPRADPNDPAYDPDYVKRQKWLTVAPTAIWYPTMVYTPTIVAMDEEELKLMSTAAGSIIDLIEKGEEKGMFYWRMVED